MPIFLPLNISSAIAFAFDCFFFLCVRIEQKYGIELGCETRGFVPSKKALSRNKDADFAGATQANLSHK
jgi:hypothetical protein